MEEVLADRLDIAVEQLTDLPYLRHRGREPVEERLPRVLEDGVHVLDAEEAHQLQPRLFVQPG